MAPFSKTQSSPSSNNNRFVALSLDNDGNDNYNLGTPTHNRGTPPPIGVPDWPPPIPPVQTMDYSDGESPPDSPLSSYSYSCTESESLTMGYTENLSATYLTTSNPCLDFFFKVVPDTPSQSLEQHLSRAWAHDPLTTLKLICNLRGVRGTGKSNKNGFYTSAIWLHNQHPKTLACNLPYLAKFGYFKDFPEILLRLLGLTIPEKMEKQRARQNLGRRFNNRSMRSGIKKELTKPAWKSADQRIRESLIRQKEEKSEASKLRHQKRAEMNKTATQRYNTDEKYRFLYDRVSNLFASQLRSDLELVKSGHANNISLAAKWCPSLNSSYDRATLLCEAIARKAFPKDEFVEYSDIDDDQYGYRVRDRLRKEVLVPLRKALDIPEVFMGARRWEKLPYNRVPSVAMETYTELFLKHDGERFKEYLEKVKYGKAKIAAGALLPHEILSRVGSAKSDSVVLVADLQWKRMVQDLSEIGKLTNCIAVCDVSGSMRGTPMEVCVALGLLLSELSEEPWKGKVITFSSNPQLHLIKGDTLKSKTKFIREMEWGMNTDFQKVFDQILKVAVEGSLPGDKMIKTVFVFSDMEFDQASAKPWETDYMVIKRKFEEKGYGEHVPEIVFWNLRDSSSIPVPGDQEGVALVSGFSKNMLKLFLEGEEVVMKEKEKLNPITIMEAAISGEEYSKLVVVD